MTRPTLKIVVFLIGALTCAVAQEKPTPPVKTQPDPRGLGVAVPDTLFNASRRDTVAKATQGLPKFDIPDYVITGAITIDLPDVEKQDPAEGSLTLEQVNPVDAVRDRATLEYASEKERVFAPALALLNGKVLVSSGTYFTSRIGLWVNTMRPNYSVSGNAGYSVSQAYLPFTNRSGGHFNVLGGMLLSGPADSPGGVRLLGDLGYANNVYRFYGSPSPGVMRSLSLFRLGAGLESPRDLLYTYGVQAGLLTASIKDSSQSNTETRFNLGFESNLLVSSVPLDGRVDISFASIAGSASGTLPFVDVSLLTPRHWYGDFYVQGSVNVYVTQGMLGQKFARVYPNVDMGYKILPGTVLSAAYLGKVQFNSLSHLIELNPYLSSNSVVRQSDLPLNLHLAAETDWNEEWRTRFSAQFQSVRDYPLLTEGGLGPWNTLWGAPSHRGIWMTEYAGTTTIMSYKADLFAKFDANSYFTLSLEINSSKNSKTQWQVPYLPEKRMEGGLIVEVLRGFTIHPTLSYVGLRVPDLYEPSKLNEHVVLGIHGTYSPLKYLDMFLDVQNLSNSKYDEWNGYRAAPFVMTGGIGFRW